MFATTSVQEFFPTPIWIVDLDPAIAAQLNSRLLADLDRMTSPRPPIPAGTTWQTEPDMHKRPQFRELTDVLRKAIAGALKFLELDYKDFVLTACWANFNPTGALNSAHTHPNNYLSGVYYVSTPSGADAIEFTDPRPGAVANLARARNLNRFNGNRMTVQTKAGRIVLFPSWLSHGVPVNRTPQERVSIAFNATFTDYDETMSPVLWKGTLPFRSE
jgi:uncharacterized protein (TIGR02466 family)